MPEQPSLPGFDGAEPTDRLFFALYPDLDAAMRIGDLARRRRAFYGMTGTPVLAEHLHVTLHHLGNFVGLPRGIVSSAREAGAAVSATPFGVVFDRVESFLHGPFVMRAGAGEADLTAFHRRLGEAMKMAGLAHKVKSGFTPHVTLLRDRVLVDAQAVDPIGWTVREFALVHSLLGQTRHIVLARWPLIG